MQVIGPSMSGNFSILIGHSAIEIYVVKDAKLQVCLILLNIKITCISKSPYLNAIHVNVFNSRKVREIQHIYSKLDKSLKKNKKISI